jgi:hypothetical protein
MAGSRARGAEDDPERRPPSPSALAPRELDAPSAPARPPLPRVLRPRVGDRLPMHPPITSPAAPKMIESAVRASSCRVGTRAS